MSNAIQEYVRHSDAFGATVRGIDRWDAPSPCEGWTAQDVLAHVVGTERDFLTSHGVALPAATEHDDLAATWTAHDAEVRAVLGDPQVAEREVEGFFGPTTIGATMARFYGFDLVVHRWDLAQAVGRDERFTDEELALLEASIEGFGEHLYAEGICKQALDVGADADRQERVLARLGRR